MAVDKKTRFELEEQKKIADEVREAFDENSTKLRRATVRMRRSFLRRWIITMEM